MSPLSKSALRKAKRKKAKENAATRSNNKVSDKLGPLNRDFIDGLVPKSAVIEEDIEIELEEPEEEIFYDNLTESILSMIISSPEADKMTDDEIEKQTREIADHYLKTLEANTRLTEVYTEQDYGFEEESDETNTEEQEDKTIEPDDFMGRRKTKMAVLVNEKGERLSRKQRKELLRPQISQLKGVAVHPDVVESWDASAKEPGLLIAMKSWPNTVNVPTHWNSKRRYLAGKRAIDRGQFKLPPHIADTKIAEIRSALLQKEEDQTLRQKMRARARPKAHRMDIDYQTLHDAFFKYAVKPIMSGYGSLYYEGKEQEMRFAKYSPGKMSESLKDALGVHTPNTPTPWLFNMQRYGPPPAYPGLRIPGVNCPIPSGADYGYGVGGWGAPAVDNQGNPLWGDLGAATGEQAWDSGTWTSYLWGDMDPSGRKLDDDEEMDEDTDEEPSMVEVLQNSNINNDMTSSGLAGGVSKGSSGSSGAVDGGMETPNSMVSGMTSTPSVGLSCGLDTPSTVDLRKGIESAQGGSLGVVPYKVLQQKDVYLGSNRDQFFQSSTLYDMQGALTSAQEAEEKATGQPAVTVPAEPQKEPPRKKRKGFKF